MVRLFLSFPKKISPFLNDFSLLLDGEQTGQYPPFESREFSMTSYFLPPSVTSDANESSVVKESEKSKCVEGSTLKQIPGKLF